MLPRWQARADPLYFEKIVLQTGPGTEDLLYKPEVCFHVLSCRRYYVLTCAPGASAKWYDLICQMPVHGCLCLEVLEETTGHMAANFF